MTNLHKKIISSFEQKQPNLRGLKGLKVKELKRVMKRATSINLTENGEQSKGSLTNTPLHGYNQSLASQDKVIENKVEIPKDENEIKFFWDNNCQSLPQNGKIGEYIIENEQLLFEIDSSDIWVRVKLEMVEQHNLIEAEMDLKVDKTMAKSRFDDMIQKLALKMWNECSQVFTKERRMEIQKLAHAQEGKQKKTTLSKLELEACKNVFVLKDFHVIIANQMVQIGGGAASFHAISNSHVFEKRDSCYSNSAEHYKTSLNDSQGPEKIVPQPETTTQQKKQVQMSHLSANKIASHSAITPLIKTSEHKLSQSQA